MPCTGWLCVLVWQSHELHHGPSWQRRGTRGGGRFLCVRQSPRRPGFGRVLRGSWTQRTCVLNTRGAQGSGDRRLTLYFHVIPRFTPAGQLSGEKRDLLDHQPLSHTRDKLDSQGQSLDFLLLRRSRMSSHSRARACLGARDDARCGPSVRERHAWF